MVLRAVLGMEKKTQKNNHGVSLGDFTPQHAFWLLCSTIPASYVSSIKGDKASVSSLTKESG